MWGAQPNIEFDLKERKESTQYEENWDPHLRSTYQVSGYGIQATDGEIGHVEDFIIDDETWAIRYLIVNMSFWLDMKNAKVADKLGFNACLEHFNRTPFASTCSSFSGFGKSWNGRQVHGRTPA